MSIAALVLSAITLLAEFGLGTCILALRDLTLRQIAQLHAMSVWLGIVAFFITAAIAWPAARFFEAPQLPPVLVVLASAFVVTSFRVVPWALLQRDLRFRRLAAFDTGQAVLLSVGAILLAWLGFGYWTLVLTNVFSALISTGVVLYFHPQRLARPVWHELREVLSFSKDLLVSRIAFFVYNQSHFFVTAKVLGKVMLGSYSLAWAVAQTPGEKTSDTVMRVTPAVFAAARHDPRATSRYLLGLVEVIATAIYPMLIGVVLVAPQFVDVVLGDQWHQMIRPLQILGIYTCFRVLHPLFVQVLHVTGDTHFESRNTLLVALLLPPAFWVGSRWGLTGIALAWLMVHPVIEARVWRRVMDRFKVGIGELGAAIWPAVSSCTCMALGVLAIDRFLPQDLPPMLDLAARVLVGAATYLAMFGTFYRRRIAGFRRFLALVRKPKQ